MPWRVSACAGRALFQEALKDGTMTSFFKLIEQYNTQDEPAYCGLTSIAMVLNALSIDPRRTWKGSWRWFHEQMLDCCKSLEQVKQEGIVLSQAACLARCNGARVELRPAPSFTLDQFRQQVLDVCTSGEEHIIVSYGRKAFLQTGDGHFSPIGGYHRGQDLALILDTARFKYPPHWVPLPLLFDAMAAIDAATGRPRGYMLLGSEQLLDSVLFTLDVHSAAWHDADRFIRHRAPEHVRTLAATCSPQQALRQLIDFVPLDSLHAFIALRDYAVVTNATSSMVPEPQRAQAAAAADAPSFGADVALMGPPHVIGSSATLPGLGLKPQQAPGAGGCGGGRHHACGPSSSHQQGMSTSAAVDPVAEAAALLAAERCVPTAARRQVLEELRSMPLYQLVRQHIDAGPLGRQLSSLSSSSSSSPSEADGYLAEKICVLLLLQPPTAWPRAWPQPEAQKAFDAYLDVSTVSIVEAEVRYLRSQFSHIEDVVRAGNLHETCGSCHGRLDCVTLGHGATAGPSAGSAAGKASASPGQCN